MQEECLRILLADLVDRLTDRLDESFVDARPCLANEVLDLRKRLLDRVEVRRVGRQVEDPCARSLDQLPHRLALVDGEVVHHHHIPLAEGGHEHLPQIALEHRAVGPALDHHRGPHPGEGHAREQRRVLAPVSRHRAIRPLAPRRIGVKLVKRGVRSHLVLKNTSLLAQSSPETITRQAALRNSSRSEASAELFFGYGPASLPAASPSSRSWTRPSYAPGSVA